MGTRWLAIFQSVVRTFWSLMRTSRKQPAATSQVPSLAAFPLNVGLLLQSRSAASLVSEITGLSQSRLRPGAMAAFRESTLQKARRHADRWIRACLANAGNTDEAVERVLGDAPSSRAGRPAPYGDLLYALVAGDRLSFPQSFALAERLDELGEQLDQAREADSLEAYRDALLTPSWLQAEEWWQSSEKDGTSDPEQVRQAKSWSEVTSASRPVHSNAIFAFMAALDCEFTTAALEPQCERPWFLDLLPSLGPGTTLEPGVSSVPLPKWDRFRLPARRLIELSHALLYYRAKRQWPESAAGRSDIARHVGYSDVVVGNLFDGTKALTQGVYRDLWCQLAKDLDQSAEPPPAPFPLLMAALAWTAMCVRFDSQRKLQRIILLDGEDYKKWWGTFRRLRALPVPHGDAIGAPSWL